jgi:hypothetical protein
MPVGTRPSALSFGIGAALAAFVAGLGLLGGCGSAADNRPAKWSYIAPAIIEPNCATASCHSEAAARAGVILTTRDKSYQTLIDRHFVIPGDPGLSEVVSLMRAVGSRRMPPDLALPEADIQLIEQWIQLGAMND